MDKVIRITFHPHPVTNRRRKERVYPLIKLCGIDYDEDTASYTVLIEGRGPCKDVACIEISEVET